MVGQAGACVRAATHAQEGTLDDEAHGLHPFNEFRSLFGDVDCKGRSRLRSEGMGDQSARDFGVAGDDRAELAIKLAGSSKAISG